MWEVKPRTPDKRAGKRKIRNKERIGAFSGVTLFLFTSLSFADQPPSVGNFALRSSQQPGCLIGFGQNIIDPNESELFLFTDDYIGVNKHFIDFSPQYIYGINEKLSFLLSTPYAVSYKTDSEKSNGFEDAYIQFEYAPYQNATSRYSEQWTVLSSLSFPTGSTIKDPATGAGAYSFFVGSTFSRTYVDWFYFGAAGAFFPGSNHGNKNGNSYLYQCAFGKNIANINGWILAWLTEFDGAFTERNRANGSIDVNSGGNVIYITPSFWASTNIFIFQLGAGIAALQNQNGDQTRNQYLIAGNIGISF